MADEKENLKEHILRIASKLRIDLDHDFDWKQLSTELTQELFVPLALELMKTKCTFVFRDEKFSWDLQIHILRGLLIRYNAKELDLTGLMTFCPNEDSKLNMLNHMITKRFVNIEVIRIFNDGFGNYYGYPRTSEGLQKLIKDLKALHNLRELQIELFAFHLNEVMDICSKLPTLEHINVILGVQQVPAKEIMLRLGNLKAFQCEPVVKQDIAIYTKFILMCMDNLTKLQLIGQPCSPFSTNYEIVNADEQGSTTNSSLRHLLIGKYMNCDRQGLQRYPHVSHLKIDFNGWAVIPDHLKNERILFQNVESLNLQNVTKRTLFIFLQTYGLYLRALHAVLVVEKDESSDCMFFTKIWKLCPRLEKLYLNYQIDEKDFETDQKILLAVSKINELKINLKTMMSTIIVTAPELTKMEITCEGFADSYLRYLENLCRDISEKKILQKLEHLTIDMSWIYPHQIQNAKYFKGAASLVKFMTTNLPKLSVVKFKLNRCCDYLRLANALKDKNTTDSEIQELSLMEGVTVESLRCIVDDDLIKLLNIYND